MADSDWSRGWWGATWNAGGSSSWEAGLTAEQGWTWEAGLTAEQDWADETWQAGWITEAPQRRRGSRGSGKGGSSFGWSADSTEEPLPPQHIWSHMIYANLADIPRDWWASTKAALHNKYECKVSYRKARHSENQMWIPYRLSVRGIEARHCSEELLDVLCTEHSHVIEPWDIEPVPLLGEGEEVVEEKHGQLQCLVWKFGNRQSSGDNELRSAFLAATPKWKHYVDPQQKE
jgi:hypothetical protein